MANEQHIKWLCEGVEAWNARREKDRFTPELAGADLRTALVEAGVVDRQNRGAYAMAPDLRLADLDDADLREAKLRDSNLSMVSLAKASLMKVDFWGTSLRSANLSEADLERAILRDADLIKASLGRVNAREAILVGSNLSDAKLFRADLSEANLQGAVLAGTDLRNAILRGASLKGARVAGAEFHEADVRSIGTGPGAVVRDELLPTDLSSSIGLSQQQLDAMIGDRWTLIPEDLNRPANWQDDENDDAGYKKIKSNIPEPATQPGPTNLQNTETGSGHTGGAAMRFRGQVDLILAAPGGAKLTGSAVAAQLDFALSTFRREAQSNLLPEDVLLIEKFSDLLQSIGKDVEQPNPKPDEIATKLAELLATIEHLTATVETQAEELVALKTARSDPSNWDQMKTQLACSFGRTMGSGVAGLIIAGSSYLLGQHGADAVNLLSESFDKLFSVAPPAAEPIGTTRT